MKRDVWRSRLLIGLQAGRLVLSAALFVPLGIMACSVTFELLGLPNPPDDDSPVVFLGIACGGVCGLAVGFVTRKHRLFNAVLVVLGAAGSITFGAIAAHVAGDLPTAQGLTALPIAMATVFCAIATAASILALAVGGIGLICPRCAQGTRRITALSGALRDDGNAERS